MVLVSYSDSEGSDSEAPPVPKAAPKPSTQAPHSAFQKTSKSSKPRNIRLDLPTPAASASTTAGKNDADGPPAKKPRLGAGGLSGFNAFLPAPKNKGPAANGAGAKRGLGKGVNLKTGAAPAFSRDAQVGLDTDGGLPEEDSRRGADDDVQPPDASSTAPTTEDREAEPTTKPVKKPMMFKPLSVANKKKKKPIVHKLSAGDAERERAKAILAESGPPLASAPPSKPKVSLFSLSGNDTTASVPSVQGEYTSFEDEATPQEDATGSIPASTTDSIPAGHLNTVAEPSSHQPANTTGPQTLDAIASDLNLSQAERRQLFGRSKHNKHGVPDLSGVNVVSFNTEKEYAANEALRAAGESVQHNPVRPIAPGKHNLKQLVNAAVSQQDALEEHFASGKRNRKEAGNRYGW